MRKAIFQVAAAVAAAAIVLLVVAVSNSLSAPVRWLLVAVTALVAFSAAWLAARRISPGHGSGVEVGNRIRSGGDVHVEDVSVEPTSQGIRIGSDIRSKRSARLARIVVGKNRRPQK